MAIERLRCHEAEAVAEPAVVVSCSGNASLGTQTQALLDAGADEVWTKRVPVCTACAKQRSLASLLLFAAGRARGASPRAREP